MRPWFWEGCEQGRTFATHTATSRSQTPWEVLGRWGTEAPGHASGEWQGQHSWLPLRTEANERQGWVGPSRAPSWGPLKPAGSPRSSVSRPAASSVVLPSLRVLGRWPEVPASQRGPWWTTEPCVDRMNGMGVGRGWHGGLACQSAVNPLGPGREWEREQLPSFALLLTPRRAPAFTKHLLYACVLRNGPLALLSAWHWGPTGGTASPTGVLPSASATAGQPRSPLDTGQGPGIGP